MRKVYNGLLMVMTGEIDWQKIPSPAKKIVLYCMVSVGFFLNISIPLSVLFYLRGGNVVALNQMIAVFAFSIFITFCAITPDIDILRFFARTNFFRVYFFYLPKGFLWCVRKMLCALIRLTRLVLLSL